MDIGKVVRTVALATAVGLASVVGAAGCTGREVQNTPGVGVSDLKPDEIEILKKYNAVGRPYLFENLKDIEEEYIKKGWDTHNLTDKQVITYCRDMKAFGVMVETMR